MCDIGGASFVTFVARRFELRGFLEAWRQSSVGRLDVEPPRLIDLSELGDVFRKDDVPSVATASVGSVPPLFVVAAAQGLATELGFNLLAEVGFQMYPAAAPCPLPIDWDDLAIDIAVNSFHSLPQLAGRSVALVDSGAATGSMVDMTLDTPCVVPAADAAGHGTIMAQLILRTNSSADISPVRVFVDSAGGRSHDVFNGLIYALWRAPTFSVISASLTSMPPAGCATALGRSLAFINGLATQSGRPTPLLLAAEGNDRPELGYPAVLPGAIVVRAVDWTGARATYSRARVPPSVTTIFAPGGTEREPLGSADFGSGTLPIFGTSCATALVAGAVLRR